MNLNRDSILQAQDLKPELVPVPEWGGDVYVRGMTGLDRESFERSMMTDEGFKAENVKAKICVRCICDENGERLFADEDALLVAKRNAVALERVYDVGQRLSGMGRNAVGDAVKK